MFDHSGQIAAPTVLHENIENASFSVDMTVVVPHDVVVVEVFEDVPVVANK